MQLSFLIWLSTCLVYFCKLFMTQYVKCPSFWLLLLALEPELKQYQPTYLPRWWRAELFELCDYYKSNSDKPLKASWSTFQGNSLDKLRHTRSVAYSAEQLLLNKQEILGGGAYPDCYQFQICNLMYTGLELNDKTAYGLIKATALKLLYSLTYRVAQKSKPLPNDQKLY